MENRSPQQRERLWRRTVSEADRAEWRGQPELELEARLTESLAQLPDASVPSNFTARVMAAIDVEDTRGTRPRGRLWNWHALLPRVAVAAAILLFAGLSLQLYRHGTETPVMVRTLSVVVTVPVPSVDALENLDAIQRMGHFAHHSAHADTELLADLQQ